MRGTVTSFDKAVGLGEIRRDDGWVVPFHCIVIADGGQLLGKVQITGEKAQGARRTA